MGAWVAALGAQRYTTGVRIWVLALLLLATACSSSGVSDNDAGPSDSGARRDVGFPPADAGTLPDLGFAPDADEPDLGFAPDADEPDLGFAPDADEPDLGFAPDAAATDAGFAPDATATDSGPTYNCGAFTVDPGWTIQSGFHAVVVASATDGLNQPVALTFAGGRFGPLLYSVNQGDDTVRATEVFTGATTVFASAAALSPAPVLLTGILWDRGGAFDGNLYVGDQGSDSDGDSRIYRLVSTGTGAAFASGPGGALDDVFGMAFSPGPPYLPGLYVSGDTDGAGPDWGRIDANGTATAFSEVTGNEGIAVDSSGRFGNLMYSASPLGGGYPGDGSIAAIMPDGTKGATLATGLGGVHALAFAPGGAHGLDLYAARWDVGQLIRIDPAGTISVIASGLSLTNYDANILAFSPDGNVLYVADRQANRIVCIEPL